MPEDYGLGQQQASGRAWPGDAADLEPPEPARKSTQVRSCCESRLVSTTLAQERQNMEVRGILFSSIWGLGLGYDLGAIPGATNRLVVTFSRSRRMMVSTRHGLCDGVMRQR